MQLHQVDSTHSTLSDCSSSQRAHRVGTAPSATDQDTLLVTAPRRASSWGAAYGLGAAFVAAQLPRLVAATSQCIWYDRFRAPSGMEYAISSSCGINNSADALLSQFVSNCGAVSENDHDGALFWETVKTWVGATLYRHGETANPADAAFEACLHRYGDQQSVHNAHLLAIILPSVIGGVVVLTGAVLGVLYCCRNQRPKAVATTGTV